METELKASDGSLFLRSSDNNWVQISLEQGGEATPLGAESLGTIVQRLIGMLTHPAALNKSGNVNGKDVAWVASLNERHCSLYCTPEVEGLRIVITGPNTDWVGSLFLGASDVSTWIDELAACVSE